MYTLHETKGTFTGKFTMFGFGCDDYANAKEGNNACTIVHVLVGDSHTGHAAIPFRERKSNFSINVLFIKRRVVVVAIRAVFQFV